MGIQSTFGGVTTPPNGTGLLILGPPLGIHNVKRLVARWWSPLMRQEWEDGVSLLRKRASRWPVEPAVFVWSYF